MEQNKDENKNEAKEESKVSQLKSRIKALEAEVRQLKLFIGGGDKDV